MNLTKTTRNPYDEISFIGGDLGVGETKRVLCPKCLGGSSKEVSCCISKSIAGRVHFNCFRAKCSWRGTLNSGQITGSSIQLPFPKKLRTFTRPVEDLNAEQIVWYRSKFGISPDDGVKWCDSTGSYAYKVFGPDGQLRGWQLRDYRPGAALKANNFVHRDEPFISWYIPKAPDVGGVVVVEDIPSARKVCSCGIASVSLLGTSMDYERAYEIGGVSEGFVILALDRGTLTKAIEYRQRYELIWGSVEIWQLDKDLKDCTRTRIKEALYNGASDFISRII